MRHYTNREFTDTNFPDLVDTVFSDCAFHDCRFGLVEKGGFDTCQFTRTTVDSLYRSFVMGCHLTKSRIWYTYHCIIRENRIIGTPEGLLDGLDFNPWGHNGTMDFVLVKLCESFRIAEKASTEPSTAENNYYEQPDSQGQLSLKPGP